MNLKSFSDSSVVRNYVCLNWKLYDIVFFLFFYSSVLVFCFQK